MWRMSPFFLYGYISDNARLPSKQYPTTLPILSGQFGIIIPKSEFPQFGEDSLTFTIFHTRWAPTSYKWSYNPYEWPYKEVTAVITLLIGAP